MPRPWATAGSGAGVQCPPSNASIRGVVADGWSLGATLPTATHLDDDEHDTELSPELVPGGEDVGITLQTLPSRDSAKSDSTVVWLVELLVVEPTATHIVTIGHETLTKMLFGGTCGLGAICQSRCLLYTSPKPTRQAEI